MGRPRGKSDPGTLDAVTRCRLWLTAAALAVAGCAGPFPQSTLRPRSDFGRAIDHLFTDIFWWAVIVFVLVETLLLVALIRFRHREGRPAPKPARGNTALEIGWTLAPAVILVLVAVPTMRTILATAGDAPPDAVKVEVIGHQWWWEYKYPNLGIVTANEMHVPVGKPVQLSITSADVIHSFWAPALGGKRDATPEHVTRIAFRPDSVGVYSGQCAEFCGASHANMRLRVLVLRDSAFQAWVRRQQAPAAAPPRGSLEARGRDVFAKSACIGCHTIDGVSKGIIGPTLSHVGGRATIAAGAFPHDSPPPARRVPKAAAPEPGGLLMPNAGPGGGVPAGASPHPTLLHRGML